MIRAAVALPTAVWASAAAASFHPVEDRPYRYDTVETRTTDGVVRRFHASRSVVFHRTATGYDVTITLDTLDHEAGEIGAMFLATTGALLHHPLRYRLDATGGIVDVEDVDAAIALTADAIERSSRDATRTGNLAHYASPLRTLPTERKRAMLLSVLSPLIAGTAADRAVGERPVTVPSRPPLPPGTALAGTESVSRNANGVVTVAVRARNSADPAAPVATVETVRNLDSAAGLVVDSHMTTESILTDGEAIHRARIETIVTLRLAVT